MLLLIGNAIEIIWFPMAAFLTLNLRHGGDGIDSVLSFCSAKKWHFQGPSSSSYTGHSKWNYCLTLN